MYRIVASDMDETFLDGRHEIPPANLEALARMRELGVLFVPSSGRGYLSIMDNFADVDPALMEGTYVLSYNGANINRFGDPVSLCERELDHTLANRLWRLGIDNGLALHAYTPDCHIYVRDLPKSERVYLSSLKRIVEHDEPDLDAFPVISKMLFMNEDLGWLHEFAEKSVRPLLGRHAEIDLLLGALPGGHSRGGGQGNRPSQARRDAWRRRLGDDRHRRLGQRPRDRSRPPASAWALPTSATTCARCATSSWTRAGRTAPSWSSSTASSSRA